MTKIGLAKATFPDLSNDEFIKLAAETGFDFVSLRLRTSEVGRENDQILPGSVGLAAVQRALGRTGLPVIDLEFLTLIETTRPEHWEWMFEVGEALGAKHLNVGVRFNNPEILDAHLEKLSQIRSSVTPLLEPVKFYSDVNYAMMLEHLDGTGLLLDTLQLARFDETKLAADLKPYVGVIQLCDAPLANPETTEELEFEARYGRIPPGDGELPLEQILTVIGPDVQISIECPNISLTESMGVTAYAKYLLERSNELIPQRKTSN